MLRSLLALAASLVMATSAAAQGPRLAPARSSAAVQLPPSARWIPDENRQRSVAATDARLPRRSYPLIGLVVGVGVGFIAGAATDVSCKGAAGEDFYCGGYKLVYPVFGAGAGLVVGSLAWLATSEPRREP